MSVLTPGLYEYREVSGEGAIVGRRDQNREWVRLHKRNCVGMVAYAEVFGDVHVFLSPLRGYVCGCSSGCFSRTCRSFSTTDTTSPDSSFTST